MNNAEDLGNIKKEHLHHAYVIESSREEGLATLRTLLKSFDISLKGNPDFHEYIFDNFLLDHAHTLRREQSMRGAGGAKKIFFVAFNTILHEAQNALLKTLEEPTEGTHFFFITRTSEVLLPTLRSRMQIIRSQPVTHSQESAEKNIGKEFLAATVALRMKMIEPMTKAKADDKSDAKEAARTFLDSLECALYAEFRGVASPSPGLAHSLEYILFAKRTLSERSPSVKLLLEHLALTVPHSRD
jgi:DNA polymerase III delta prime subunit